MGERVLITGGAGFIGTALARRHRGLGDRVDILVRPGRLPPAAGVHPVALDNAAAVAACLDVVCPTIVYHLASGTGRDPSLPRAGDTDALLGDVDTLLTLVGAAAAMAHPPRVVVRTGSLAEYGNGPSPAREDQREAPLTTYTAAMVAGAHYARMLQPVLPFRILTARLALTYGPGQATTYLVPWLIDRLLAGLPAHIAAPDNRRDMIFVEDVVDGLVALAGSTVAGGTIVNLATGLAPTVRSIARLVLAATGCDPARLTYDGAHADGRADVVLGATDLAADLIGWRARTDLARGIALTTGGRRCEPAVAA